MNNFFFRCLFETWNNGKKLRVSIRRVKIAKVRICVKCFEALNYIINLLVCNSSYHTSRIIPLSFVTQLILCVIKNNLMHYLSSVYFVNQPLHVSGIFVTHHQEVCSIYIYIYIYINLYVLCFLVGYMLAGQQTVNTYQLLYIYSIPPDDGLQICPQYVEVDWRNKLRINSASSWYLLHRCIEMYGQQNIKLYCVLKECHPRCLYQNYSRSMIKE